MKRVMGMALATTLALLLPALPAAAQGVSITLVPRSAAETEALRLALMLYALREGGSGVVQGGQGNAAALLQSGGGQVGLIRQRGRGHRATLTQTAPGTAWAIIQGGRGAQAAVTQDRPGDVGLTLQYGW
ncbi:MAG: curlin [Rhodobacterales bacterium]|nr:curlin [Rhodobacterales bacterium]NCT12052.1 curlin [Rhodobacterales bacterium]